MTNLNKNISIWKGEREPPTIYHLWLKKGDNTENSSSEESSKQDTTSENLENTNNADGLYEYDTDQKSWVLITSSGSGDSCSPIEKDTLTQILI